MAEVRNYRGIPPPILEPHVSIEIRPPVRRSKPVSYVKTDQRFLIELRFPGDCEFALFERFLLGSPLRITEYKSEYDKPARTFVSDPTIGDVEGAWRWVREELPRIWAAIVLFCPEFIVPPTCRCVIGLDFDGNGHNTALTPDIMTHEPSRKGVCSAIAVINDSSLGLWSSFQRTCDSDPDYREALMYFGQGIWTESSTSWANLYRAYEVMTDRFGGVDGIDKMKFATKTRLGRFKRTVNHQEAIGAFSRHARMNQEPPPNPMTFDEAGKFILSLLNAWRLSDIGPRE